MGWWLREQRLTPGAHADVGLCCHCVSARGCGVPSRQPAPVRTQPHHREAGQDLGTGLRSQVPDSRFWALSSLPCHRLSW